MIKHVIAAFLLVIAASAAQAQDGEWDKLVAAANAEGAITMESQPNKAARDFILAEWAKAYPKIALSLSVIPAPQLLARIRTERAAGMFLWDLAVAGPNTAWGLLNDKALDPLRPEFVLPDVKDPATWGGWENAFFDNEGQYVFAVGGTLTPPYYNAGHVSPERVKAKGLKVMLDPAFKGRIAWHDPSIAGSGRAFVILLRRQLGDDGLRRLIVDQKTVFPSAQNEIVEQMARDTIWFGIGPVVTTMLKPYAAAGVKVDVRPFGNTPEVTGRSAAGNGLYVFNRRPHPNATRLFVNWFLSRDVQGRFAAAMELDMRRIDVPAVSPPEAAPVKGAKYIEFQRETFEAETEEAAKLVAEVRRSVR
jgi:iron(III) transport system substrate-binding protein